MSVYFMGNWNNTHQSTKGLGIIVVQVIAYLFVCMCVHESEGPLLSVEKKIRAAIIF